MRACFQRYISLFCIVSLAIMTSSCATDRLITRKNHDHDMQLCWQRLADANGDNALLNERLADEISDYQILTEEVLAARESALKLTGWISSNIDSDTPIPPRMLDKLNKGMARGLELTDKVVSVVAKNECWLQATDEKLADKGLAALDQYTRYKGFMLALSATLMLYDTYLSSASILNEHDRIRQFLNQSDSGYGRQQEQLRAVTNTIFNTSNIMLVRKEILFYEDRFPGYLSQLSLDDGAYYLSTLIRQSPTYPIIRNATIDDIKDQQEMHASAEVNDNLLEINRSAFNGVSKFFGNIVGLVEERKGKLYKDEESHSHLLGELKAGDILLEKTPFRLTDKMIPGHWGHAAIWIGSEKELKELGIWGHPVVQNYQEQISNERGVVEALRSGVEINTLANFMNIDDAAIIRDPDKTKAETAERIIRTLRQIGKDYDFNYDVETTDKIVCSQLVYLAYTDIEWPTERVVGRYTISPDNVAYKAINSGQLELVVFYHDGNHIEEQPDLLMETLMRKN